MSLRATKTLATTDALTQVKQFILYHTPLKSNPQKHTHTQKHSVGHIERMGIMGFCSTLQLALTCWVVNRLRAIILFIHDDDVHAKKRQKHRGDKSSVLLLVSSSSFATGHEKVGGIISYTETLNLS